MGRFSSDDDDDLADDEQEGSSKKGDKRLYEQELREVSDSHRQLEQRIAYHERRQYEDDKDRIRNQHANALSKMDHAEQVLSKAIAEANGDDAATALRYRDEALKEKRQCEEVWEQVQANERRAQQAPKSEKLDPVVRTYAQEWIAANPWYDPNGGNQQSKFALLIDQSLVDEGYSPKTRQYWKELDKRVRARLPEYFEDSEPKRKSSSKEQIEITPERRDAMIQAGVWDDPVLRRRYAKAYQRWDRDNEQL